MFYISVRGQENGLDSTKSGGPSGRGTDRGRRGRGRGRGDSLVGKVISTLVGLTGKSLLEYLFVLGRMGKKVEDNSSLYC